jgi:uncharacterized membrane protein YvbJ
MALAICCKCGQHVENGATECWFCGAAFDRHAMASKIDKPAAKEAKRLEIGAAVGLLASVICFLFFRGTGIDSHGAPIWVLGISFVVFIVAQIMVWWKR